MLKRYNRSLLAIVQDIFPDHAWDESRFSVASELSFPYLFLFRYLFLHYSAFSFFIIPLNHISIHSFYILPIYNKVKLNFFLRKKLEGAGNPTIF